MDNSGWFEEEKLDKDSENVKYEPRNMANVISFTYLGKSFTPDVERVKNLPIDKQIASSSNCQTTLLFASLVGGNNTRIDAATNEDPYLYIDMKWFDLKPNNYYDQWVEKYNPPEGVKLYEYINDLQSEIDEYIPDNNILSSVTYDREIRRQRSFDGQYHEVEDFITNPVYNIKTLTSDGSIIIESNYGRYWWGTNVQPNGDSSNISPDNILNLKAVEYSIENNICDKDGTFFIDLQLSTKNKKQYITSDIEAGEGICIAEYNFSLNPYQGKLEEDLSEIVPEGVVQIGCLTKCVP